MMTIIVLLTFALSAVLSFRACEPYSALYVVDLPNHRSLHTVPKPRSGGVGVVCAGLLGSLALMVTGATPFEMHTLAPLGQALLLIALVSFFDDLYGVSALLRMPCHLLAATWVVAHGWVPDSLLLFSFQWEWSSFTAYSLTLLFLAWMTNLYNFMDGMDGFSGGMAAIGFAAFAVMGTYAGNTLFASLALVVVAAVLGFLLFNFPPSSLFMGDTGACTLGFLVALFTLWGVREGVCSLWSALVLFLPFTLDATITLLGRISRFEKVWEGERNHYYHWLLLRVGHKKALFRHYPLMLLTSCCSVVGNPLSTGGQVFLSSILVVAFVAFYMSIKALASRLPLLPEMETPQVALDIPLLTP
jgi:UDP-N-acetylmuramyl pentapeptide phosphotransferase/UDP-N-acetylglucosamine-1-phosphate transferase